MRHQNRPGAYACLEEPRRRNSSKLEAAISAKLKATPEFAERAEIIESVPGLAQATSAILIAGMPELGQVSDEVAAALIGVAPYDDDSGKRRGEHYIKGGRRWVRETPSTCPVLAQLRSVTSNT